MTLKVTFTSLGRFAIINLIGSIDEESEHALKGLSSKLSRRHVTCVFNFSGVTRLNSSGARIWYRFVAAVAAQRELYVEECPLDVLWQMALIPSLKSLLHVSSVRVELTCRECQTTCEKLLALGEGRTHCDRCGATIMLRDTQDLDDLITEYAAAG